MSRARNSGGRSGVLLVVIGSAALLGWAWLAWQAPRQTLASYLAAYIFFLGPALGSMALLMAHALTGGRWGLDLRAALLAALRTLPLLALLLLPLLVGARWLYPWAARQSVQSGPAASNLAQQGWYLNCSFFVVRAVVCFGLWLALAGAMRRNATGATRSPRIAGIAAAGLIVYALTISVAGVDWIMSLIPAWHSSAFGLMVGTSQMLSAGALAAAATSTRSNGSVPSPERLRDLGSLLLMLVLAWAYLAFAEYLTVWIADLPVETIWYLPRLRTTWHWLGVWLVVFGLLLPLAVLLSRRAKAQKAWILGISLVLLAGQAIYACWLVLPSARPAGFALSSSDALAWIGIGALVLRSFLAAL